MSGAPVGGETAEPGSLSARRRRVAMETESTGAKVVPAEALRGPSARGLESDDATAASPRRYADLALSIAAAECGRYEQMSRRSIRANSVSEALLLIVGAATTVMAGLHAPAPVTASLAAASLLLAGARSTNDWKGLAVSRTRAWHDMEAVLHQYTLTPVEARDEKSYRDLVARVDEIAATERAGWAASRLARKDPTVTERGIGH